MNNVYEPFSIFRLSTYWECMDLFFRVGGFLMGDLWSPVWIGSLSYYRRCKVQVTGTDVQCPWIITLWITRGEYTTKFRILLGAMVIWWYDTVRHDMMNTTRWLSDTITFERGFDHSRNRLVIIVIRVTTGSLYPYPCPNPNSDLCIMVGPHQWLHLILMIATVVNTSSSYHILVAILGPGPHRHPRDRDMIIPQYHNIIVSSIIESKYHSIPTTSQPRISS